MVDLVFEISVTMYHIFLIFYILEILLHEKTKQARCQERVTAQLKAIQINAEWKAKIDQIIMKLQGCCSVCWLLNGEKDWDHQLNHCRVIMTALGGPWKSLTMISIWSVRTDLWFMWQKNQSNLKFWSKLPSWSRYFDQADLGIIIGISTK